MKFFTFRFSKLLLVFIGIAFYTDSYAQKTWDGGAGTNNWNDGNNWNPNGVPTAGQTVTIGNTYTVILNTSTTVASLTIGGGTSGSLTIGNNNTDRTLTVTGNVIVNTGATLNTAGNGGNVINIGGNLTNDGAFDMNIGGADCDVTFNGAANQTISGAGATTDFNRITVNNTGAANNNIVEILPSNFTAEAGFLTLTDGIIKMSGSYTLTNTFFNTANYTIPAIAGIWLNNPNVTVTAQGNNISLRGLLRITAGTYNVGTANTHKLLYFTGSTIIMEGGALNVAAALGGNGSGDEINYNQSGGTVTVSTIGVAQTWASFEIWAAASVFTMSGGTIILQRLNSAFTDYYNASTNATVTGGTLQAGNASTLGTDFFWINSTPPLYNLVVNTTNNPRAELRVNTTVLNDVTNGAILDVSPLNVNITVGRHWVNNGTFMMGTGTVTFNGAVLQQISGSSTTTFYNLATNNTVGVATTGITLQSPAIVTNTLTLTNGHITTTATNILTMNEGSSVLGSNYGASPRVSGGSDNSFINGPMRKVGSTAFLFPVGKIGSGHHFCGISAPGVATNAFEAEYMRVPATSLGAVTAVGLSHVSNCEYWRLDEVGTGTPTVDVTLSWNSFSGCNFAVYINDIATLRVAHSSGSNWNSFGGSTDPLSGNITGSITWNGVNTFSPFALASTSALTNPLPVKLVNVKAYSAGDRNKIEWTNLTETDVLTYEVERSSNGTQFSSMSSLAPKSNTNGSEDYFTYDLQRSPVTYYRIKVTGNDRKIIYSPIVKVATENHLQQDITLYPNPVTGRQFTLQMNNAAGNYVLRIYAANGQVIKTETLKHLGGSYSKTIELPGQLQAGQYYLQISGGEKITTSKFIIQ